MQTLRDIFDLRYLDTSKLVVVKLRLGCVPLHLIRLRIVQGLVHLYQRGGVKGRVAVGTLHLLQTGIKFDDAAAARAFVFQDLLWHGFSSFAVNS